MRIVEKVELKRLFVTLDHNDSDEHVSASFMPPEDGWRLDHIDRVDDEFGSYAYVSYSRLTFPAS